MHNVVHAPEAAALLRELDHALSRKLGAHQDEFLPGAIRVTSRHSTNKV